MTHNSTDTETDDEFYDSLDRIISSSNSSASASASDNDDGGLRPTVLPRNRRRRRHLESLHLWTSAPASVADRRRRLLHLLGLSADPSLSRNDVTASNNLDDVAVERLGFGDDVTVGRESGQLSDAAIVGRFGYGDDVMEAGDDVTVDGVERGQLPNSAMGRFRCTDDVIKSGDDVTVSVGCGGQLSGAYATVEIERFSSSDDVSVLNSSVAQFDGLEQRSVRFSVANREEEGTEGIVEVEEGTGCVFKNLDNGKEFVVRDSDRVRDVETGRQLTMEEFEKCVGRSPIVQELMQRQNVENMMDELELRCESVSKRKGVWLRSIKNVLGVMMNHRRRGKMSSSEKDTLGSGGPRSSSATDDSQDGSRGMNYVNSRRVRVRRYGKSQKELTCLVKNQEIQAHDGSIWSMKFSLDGWYLASAGVDRVIHVWEVVEIDQRGNLQTEKVSEENASCNRFGVAVNNNLREPASGLSTTKENLLERQRSKRLNGSRKNVNSEPLMVPDHIFALSEKPTCSFRGHLDDILDLSWSKSLHLLSSSMDKTVRLWHLSSKTCLKIFSHTDYVTCIQFNPVDDRFFISGSLDEKVRIWSIPDRQIVDWDDLHEMVTAVCYAPDGQSALVGSHKGSCHLYDTSDNKLLQKSQVELGNKKKKSRHKKITGFQFSPGSSTKVLITSADSRIRVVDGDDLVHKFKGFRNTSSQISAHFTSNGMYLICSSEDSNVYLWRYDDDSQPSRNKGVPSITESYEHFYCEGVTVAIPWSSCTTGNLTRTCSNTRKGLDDETQSNLSSLSKTIGQQIPHSSSYLSVDYQQHSVFSPKSPNSNHCNDRVSATWPEELMTANKHITQPTADLFAEGMAAPSRSAWGLVIVTAGSCGQIRIFQNYGLPVGMSDHNSG